MTDKIKEEQKAIPDEELERINQASVANCPEIILDEYGKGLWKHGYKAGAKSFFTEMLSEKQKELTAFALFSAGMKIGPSSFDNLEAIAKKVGVEKEFEKYAKDWLDYAERKKNEK